MPMTPVALQLKDYTFFRIEFGPNPETYHLNDIPPFRPIDNSDLECTLRAVGEPNDAGEDLIISLDSWVTDEALKNNAMCYFYVEMMGKFSLPLGMLDKYKNDEVIKTAIIGNCAAILYGALRDQIHTLSMKTPFGAVTLPTCSFQSLQKLSNDEKVSSSDDSKVEQPKKKSRKKQPT